MPRLKKTRQKKHSNSTMQMSAFFAVLYKFRIAFTLLTLGSGVLYLVHTDLILHTQLMIANNINAACKKLGLVVNNIVCEGLEKTTVTSITKAALIEKNMPIFSIDLQEAKSNIEKLPWVHSAMVMRKLPNEIVVRLSERHPTAIWQKDKKLYLIDEYGNVIEHLNSKDYAHLLLIVGDEAPLIANAFIKLLNKFPNIKSHIASAINHLGRRWDIILHNGTKIKLPEESLENALQHLTTLDKEHNIMQGDIKIIDIRLKDRSFFYMSPKAKMTKFTASSGRET